MSSSHAGVVPSKESSVETAIEALNILHPKGGNHCPDQNSSANTTNYATPPANKEQALEYIENCATVSRSSEDIWRHADGTSSVKIVNEKIEITYSISGCPNKSLAFTDNYPSCEEFYKEIESSLMVLQESAPRIVFKRVSSNPNIQIRLTDENIPFGKVRWFNSNNNELEQTITSGAIQTGLNIPSDSNKRASHNTLTLNTQKCMWIGDPKMCTDPQAIKPPQIPEFKTLVLHEMMHSIGFQHTRCHRNLSVAGPGGGHQKCEMNLFDTTMVNTYYEKVYNSLK